MLRNIILESFSVTGSRYKLKALCQIKVLIGRNKTSSMKSESSIILCEKKNQAVLKVAQMNSFVQTHWQTDGPSFVQAHRVNAYPTRTDGTFDLGLETTNYYYFHYPHPFPGSYTNFKANLSSTYSKHQVVHT